jgi:hypothetical protein
MKRSKSHDMVPLTTSTIKIFSLDKSFRKRFHFQKTLMNSQIIQNRIKH